MDEIYSRNPDVIFRKIADEFILVPIRQKAVDFKCVYTLNGTAAFIWQSIDSVRSISQIQGMVSDEFEVDVSRANSDVSEIMSQWESLSLIRKA